MPIFKFAVPYFYTKLRFKFDFHLLSIASILFSSFTFLVAFRPLSEIQQVFNSSYFAYTAARPSLYLPLSLPNVATFCCTYSTTYFHFIRREERPLNASEDHSSGDDRETVLETKLRWLPTNNLLPMPHWEIWHFRCRRWFLLDSVAKGASEKYRGGATAKNSKTCPVYLSCKVVEFSVV